MFDDILGEVTPRELEWPRQRVLGDVEIKSSHAR